MSAALLDCGPHRRERIPQVSRMHSLLQSRVSVFTTYIARLNNTVIQNKKLMAARKGYLWCIESSSCFYLCVTSVSEKLVNFLKHLLYLFS